MVISGGGRQKQFQLFVSSEIEWMVHFNMHLKSKKL